MTPSFSPSEVVSAPILSVPRRSSVYALFALAMFLTLAGIAVGITFAMPIIASGWVFLLLMLEFVLVLTARVWSRTSPLNVIMFALFPLISGMTITPFLLSVVAGYANGSAILLNAAIATTLLTGAAAVLSRIAGNLMNSIGGLLINAVIGLIILGILQIFFPSLRGGAIEVIASGIGVVVFSLYLALNIQRVERMHATGMSPVLLALSLYLDAFNLFLFVVRLMVAVGGNRR